MLNWSYWTPSRSLWRRNSRHMRRKVLPLTLIRCVDLPFCAFCDSMLLHRNFPALFQGIQTPPQPISSRASKSDTELPDMDEDEIENAFYVHQCMPSWLQAAQRRTSHPGIAKVTEHCGSVNVVETKSMPAVHVANDWMYVFSAPCRSNCVVVRGIATLTPSHTLSTPQIPCDLQKCP